MKTRTAGVLYLLLAILAPFSMMVVPSRVLVAGDAAATAARLAANPGLFRAGMLVDVAIFSIELVLTALLFLLFEHVSRPLALAATFARLSMAVLQGLNVAVSAAALREPAFALQLLTAHTDVVLIWQTFFGLHCVFLGLLVFRSGFVPRALGVLLLLAAGGYLSDALGRLLVPGYGAVMGWLVGPLAAIGELAFTLWLLVHRGAPPAAHWARMRLPPESVTTGQ
jgi:hypothetical protein